MDTFRHLWKHVNVPEGGGDAFKTYREFLVLPFVIFMFLEILKFLYILLGEVECVGASGSVEEFLANPPGDMSYINLTCGTEIKYAAFPLFIYSFLYIIVVCSAIYINGSYVEKINETMDILNEAEDARTTVEQAGAAALRQSQEFAQQLSPTRGGAAGLLGGMFTKRRPRSMTTVVQVNRRAVGAQLRLRKLLGRFYKVKIASVVCYAILLLVMLIMTYSRETVRDIYDPHMSLCKDMAWNRPRQAEYRCHFKSELIIYALALVADIFRGLFLLSSVGTIYTLRRYHKYAVDSVLRVDYGNIQPVADVDPSSPGRTSSPLHHDEVRLEDA